MANIIGEPLSGYVAEQIKARQKAHGSGTLNNPRTPEYLVYLNSKTAWVKMASSITVTADRLKKETDSAGHSVNPTYEGVNLAKKFILFSGISELKGEKLKPRGTYALSDNNVYGWDTGTYSVNPFSTSTSSPTGEFGLTPMPGIESVDVKCQNRGSIKKVSVKLKCYSPEQFKIIDLLYLRIGYTMFIEWGWAPYLDNSGNLVKDYFTLIEQSGQGFFDVDYWKNKPYIDFSKKIERVRFLKNGNYDGLLCKVTNFSWTFSQDGSYDIDIQLISLGDVIESLKTNVTPSYKLMTDINAAYKLFNDAYSPKETQESPPSPVDNIISAYFFLQKLATYQGGQNGTNKYWEKKDIPCKIGGTDIDLFGVFVQNSSTELIEGNETKSFYSRADLDAWLTTNYPGSTQITDLNTYNTITTPGTYYYLTESDSILGYSGTLQIKNITDPTALNIAGQQKSDIIYLNYNTREDDEDVVNDLGFYIRFGHLLDFIKARIIPKIKGTQDTLILDIDSSQWGNEMYAFPYQVSLDPRVCIVHTEEKINTKEYYTSLPVWKKDGKRFAYPMNIYLNFNKINEIISANLDDKGNLALFDFISSICTELNKALGGINTLEPVVDEVTNQLKIIDGSYSDEKKPDQYNLELYGYNQNNPAQSGTTVSNFVRNFNIKTEITNDFATMATIGSTAGGYVKGTENTMFSKWNEGIVDRFKEKIIPADKDALEKYNGRDDPNAAYYEEFWTRRYGAFGLTIPLELEKNYLPTWLGGIADQPALDNTIIDKNIAIVTEFYKYCHSKLQEVDKKYASTSNGFVPISLGLTMDGLSGIKIYNALNVVTRVLPSNYPDALKFIVKGVNHKISKNDWETTIETVVISNSDSDNTAYYKSNTTFVTNNTNAGTGTNTNPSPSPSPSPSGASGSNLLTGQAVVDILIRFMKAAGIPQNTENIKFFKAWKQAETTKAKNSLFGSTQGYNNSTKFNSAGVQNYKSIEDSITAHVKTIQNRYYPNLYKDLKDGRLTALQIAEKYKNTELKTWGTGGLLAEVLKGGVKDKNLKIYY
jgi:hypothetical protein